MKGKDIYERYLSAISGISRYPAPEVSDAVGIGIHTRILKRIFTPEDAEIAMKLKTVPETAVEIAARLGADRQQMEKTLHEMSQKGLIFRTGKPGGYRYMASAFLVGIIEFQMNRMTPELARDMEEFAPLLYEKTWMKGKTRDLRTIPISESVDSESQVMPYESAEQVIRSAKYIAISDCMCRKIKELTGNPCRKPSEVCFHFGSGSHYFVENGLARYIDRTEALAILKKGIEASLVCQLSSSQNPSALCMCCACCCGPLQAFMRQDKPAELINSSFFAQVSKDNCTGCELCVDLCPINAISMDDDIAAVNRDRCIGCGVCAGSCPAEAIKTFRKDKEH